MRLFRQTSSGDWDKVMQDLLYALEDEYNKNPNSSAIKSTLETGDLIITDKENEILVSLQKELHIIQGKIKDMAQILYSSNFTDELFMKHVHYLYALDGLRQDIQEKINALTYIPS
jgi:hypothetical protein